MATVQYGGSVWMRTTCGRVIPDLGVFDALGGPIVHVLAQASGSQSTNQPLTWTANLRVEYRTGAGIFQTAWYPDAVYTDWFDGNGTQSSDYQELELDFTLGTEDDVDHVHQADGSFALKVGGVTILSASGLTLGKDGISGYGDFGWGIVKFRPAGYTREWWYKEGTITKIHETITPATTYTELWATHGGRWTRASGIDGSIGHLTPGLGYTFDGRTNDATAISELDPWGDKAVWSNHEYMLRTYHPSPLGTGVKIPMLLVD